ncbi:MAG: hypothetical protein U5K55_16295 [Aliarcobacter sp.]|nr:hypothetical protein [Aliarcobacter sp.]
MVFIFLFVTMQKKLKAFYGNRNFNTSIIIPCYFTTSFSIYKSFLTTGQLIRSISHQARTHGGQELSGQIENQKD